MVRENSLSGFFIGPAVVGVYVSNAYSGLPSATTAMVGAALGYQILM